MTFGWNSLLHRRDVLRVGSLSLAASVLPTFTARGEPIIPTNGKAKSVLYLWMGGGVTHIDSFDPKPEAPEGIRGTLETIPTALPGVHFTEVMPRLARLAAKFALVRSFSHDSNDHLLSQVYTLSGRKVTAQQLFSEPNIGSVVSHLFGPRNGLPGYIAVPGITRPGPPPHNLFVGGWLGNQYAPFCLGGQPDQPDFTVGNKEHNPTPRADEDLNPKELSFPSEVTLARLDGRARLRDRLEQSLRTADADARLSAMDGQYENALNLLQSPQVRGAFDLESEKPEVRDWYGRTKIGGRCLAARKLIEGGARFVMVDYGYDPDYGNLWDNHNAAGQNFPHICDMAKRGYHLAGTDRAVAALIEDLEQRGLLDSTLVVFLTEFGRTPKINKDGGRDHWGAAGSIFFTGGGTRPGQVIGATDKEAAYVTTRGWGPADIAATIYHAIGVSPESRIRDLQDRPHPILDHGEPIEGVLS